MRKATVISGDIVSSTSLVLEDRAMLEMRLRELLGALADKFETFGRLIKGDYLECVCKAPQDALQVALAIKSFVKSIEVQQADSRKDNIRIKLFKTHGIRLAIGYGDLPRYDPEKGIMDGEAVYLAGRLINQSASTHDKERVVIKNTLFFTSHEENLNEQFEPIMALLDILLSKATSRQSEVLYWKLMGKNEDEIAEKLGISQSVVNQHSTSVGWNSIEKTVEYFAKTLKKDIQ
ncbi:fumarate hydratase [Echinicola sp. CAU 1574]|uniref:Fumarate hydratase n=1 Tax=Echinicola arenosa TaxID=2774144 RepID=A0ABR9AP76_9BACT|nr:LuxR C-terminal-related transcriptional regulator [Echinicola arenosa]MBD8490598.1 fumarate hydratase [Echinicola arenosa]